MDLIASYDFNAPVQKVWDLLMDAEAVGACLPGCRGLKEAGTIGTKWNSVLRSRRSRGTSRDRCLGEQGSAESYTLVVEGSGRQGFVKGTAHVKLEVDSDRTRVHVTARADVGGLIARLGQRLLEGVAKATMDRFYACLAKRAESGPNS